MSIAWSLEVLDVAQLLYTMERITYFTIGNICIFKQFLFTWFMTERIYRVKRELPLHYVGITS